MTDLLVSVRSAAEARAALLGGAGLIDVKEPARGALGRAETKVIQGVIDVVAGRVPVSAALGEWIDEDRSIPALGLSYVKWGLAGCARRPHWRREIEAVLDMPGPPQIVLAAYADWECAQAPPLEEVLRLAQERPGSVLLIDTHCKDANNPLRKARPTLLDWLPSPWIEDLCQRARAAKVRVALAGSLGAEEIATLAPARPDWFAVRGAVCAAGDRHASIESDKVRVLADLVIRTTWRSNSN